MILIDIFQALMLAGFFTAFLILFHLALTTAAEYQTHMEQDRKFLSEYDLTRRNSIYGRIRPYLQPIQQLLNRSPQTAQWLRNSGQTYQDNLLLAGNPGNLTGPDIITLKYLLAIILALAVGAALQWKPVFILIAAAFGFFIPDLKIKDLIKDNKDDIGRNLPDALDIFALMVSAGQDFSQAVDVYLQSAPPGRLKEELQIFRNEIRLGTPRATALANIAKRTNSPILNDFVRSTIQAERTGTPLAKSLDSQAEDLRAKRFQNAETAGQKATFLMLIPLLLFILPACFIVLFGPMAANYLENL